MDTILISSPRSGTNFFLSVYRQCAALDLVLGEIFRQKTDNKPLLEKYLALPQPAIIEMARNRPLELWTAICTRAEADGRGTIAKIFCSHAASHPELWDYFYEKNRVIHLIRRNQFDALVSLRLAQQTRNWRSKEELVPGEYNIELIELRKSDVESHIENKKNDVQRIRMKYSDKTDYIELFYEDIAHSPQVCADHIYEILNIPRRNLENFDSIYKKLNVVDNKDRVMNYSDVAKYDCNIF